MRSDEGALLASRFVMNGFPYGWTPGEVHVRIGAKLLLEMYLG